ncbi:hypothetical protein LBMAG21_01450 [Armatimonadota bacterium]|nr:hypothetical protein LBMAG21_01450 [Armatimonadota bacterium]
MQIRYVKTPNLEDSVQEAPITEPTESVIGDAQEAVNSSLFVVSDPDTLCLIDELFEVVDLKYGEALRNLAK